MNPDFDAAEHVDFAPGVVRGVRSWKVNSDGILCGIYYQTVWKPGENKARCFRSVPAVASMISLGMHDLLEVLLAQRESKHSAAEPSCSCGFYAYTSESIDYPKREIFSGVIEGYGKCVLGTHGFRAQKARIVALCIPKSHKPWVGSSGWLGPPKSIILSGILLCLNILGILSIVTKYSDGSTAPVWSIILFSICVIGATLSVLIGPVLKFPDYSHRGRLTHHQIKQIRQIYGKEHNVPIYKSFDEMINKHPPTPDL